MQGRNPYSPYLPANNPSIFAKQKDDNLSKYLGMGGTVVGGVIGGIYGGPAGASAGASIGGMAGKGVGSIIDGGEGSEKEGAQSLIGAGAGVAKWYEEEAAKEGAAAMLDAIGGA